ncbi:DUF4326 domain-containing protein [Schlesneria sp. T3-172]|uniref:DUF4326 domain-containing protein n=1 Tax=Schlesneria sphaerica TaxID=3373610 RepID=UPI0037C7903D
MTQTILRNTTVVNVRGLNPDEWTADPQNVYVGREFFIRQGKHEGLIWPNSGLGNPFKFENGFTLTEKIEWLFRYTRHLKDVLNTQPLNREKFLGLQGKTLGCWCVRWNGMGDVPLCHAAWLARIVDVYSEPFSTGVVVERSGRILQRAEETDSESRVVFRKVRA